MDNWDMDRIQFDQYSAAHREEDKVINRLIILVTQSS
jgi:hypothetical protein